MKSLPWDYAASVKVAEATPRPSSAQNFCAALGQQAC